MRTTRGQAPLIETIAVRAGVKKQGLTIRQTSASKNIVALKKLSQLSDDTLSACLEITSKTFRSYKKTGAQMKENIQERVSMLLALFKHGTAVFGSIELFNSWLAAPNFHFDNKPPIGDLKKIEGIHFIDDRLTGIEYGDNA